MTKGILKKTISFILAFCLVVGVIPAMASAAETGDNISDESIEDETMLIIPVTSEAPAEDTDAAASGDEPATVAETTTDPDIVTGKTRRSFYRDDKVAALRSNIEKYTWAQGSRDYYTKNAEKFLGNEEKLWNSVTTQELPRSYMTGFRADPKAAFCRYCGVDMNAEYGTPYYAWIIDAWTTPWKIQCPSCRKSFPTNDFGSFYELGIGEDGKWSYELAKSENAKLVAAGEEGYLVNNSLPEKGSTWGVDDGWGYVDPNSTFTDARGNVLNSTHTYISFYNHWGIWHTSLLYDAADWLGNAYLYTGDERYGNAGAILMDRIADVYPDLTTEPFRHQLTDGGHYAPKGKASDLIWENQLAKKWCETYDAVWPAYENEEVITFLSGKASQYKMENDKTTPAKIRQNCEDGILREIYRSYQCGLIQGNFGMPQSTLAIAAVVLDTMPETKEMIDFIYRDGETLSTDGSAQGNLITGGNVNRQIFDYVDANGVTDEVAPNYSDLWVGGLNGIINYLEGYDKYEAADFYKNPRYVKMFTHQLPTLLRRKATVQIGDSGATAKDSFIGIGRCLKLYENTKLPIFAQALYHNNGRSTKGLVYGVYHSDPESLATDIQNVIDTYGEYDFDKSVNLTDYGFAHIKSVSHENVYSKYEESERSFWMYYGRYAGHGHRDALNLGIEAKGLSVAPELGYPDGTTGDRYDGWGKTTVTHNTVMVNDGRQFGNRTTGVPYHFDGTEKVKVMDASAKQQYSVDEYCRTVISVDIDDENSYAVDLFHIKGGRQHLYTFHALSDTIAETENLNLVPQTDSSGNYVGTYTGASYTYGQYDSAKRGFNYLYNVDRAKNVSGGNFMVDFKITDFREVRTNPNQDTHLRMTMINGFDLAEVAITDGNPPNKEFNPEKLKFVLARRSGTNLNTLFTTVFEPYNDESAIKSIENADIQRVDGKTIGESEVRSLKITLKNGRVDYVTMAKDSSIEYIVDDFLNVKGFVTVYSVKEGKNVYSYVNDGTKVGDLTAQAAYNGSIVDFTKENAFENTITVTFDEAEVDTEDLIGRFMYVNHGGDGNATYEILDVTKDGDNYILDIGDITLIDKLDDDGNYVYKIAAGNTFRIPLSKVKEPESDIYYNFLKAYNYNATNYISNGYAQTITYGKTTAGSEYELNRRISSAPWAFHSYIQGGTNGNDYYKYNESTYGITLAHMTREKCATAALKIKVESTGKYVPMVNINGGKNYDRAAFAKMSLCKLNTDGSIGDAIASRHINTANYTADDHYVALTDTPVNIAAGEYVFVINQDYVSGVTVVDGLSLVKAEKAVATDIKLGYEEGLVEVNVGDTTSTPVAITMSDGSTAKLSDLEVEFTDDSIVDYSIYDNKVQFTGLKEGSTQMTIRHGKAMVRTNVKVNAKDTTVAPADLHYNFYKSMPEKVNSVVNHYYSNTYNYALTTNGAYGEVREDLTSDPWAVVSKKDTKGNDDPDLYFSRLYTSYAFLYHGAGTVTLRLKVPVDGMYSPAMIIGVNNHKVAATYSLTSLDGSKTYTTKTIPAGTTGGEVAISDAPIALKAGDYLLNMSKTTTGNNFLDGVSLDYEGEYVAPSIFGDKNAFIRNIAFTAEDNSTRYRAYLFAGIDSLDYQEVGFEVSANGKTTKIGTRTVFSKFQASNVTVTAATLGTGCTRIFAESVTFSTAYKDATVTYRPYALDFDGNYIYGKETTINGVYTAQTAMLSLNPEYELELD